MILLLLNKCKTLDPLRRKSGLLYDLSAQIHIPSPTSTYLSYLDV